MYIYICIYFYTCICIHIRIYFYTRMCVHIHVCTYIHIYVYISICVYIYIWKYYLYYLLSWSLITYLSQIQYLLIDYSVFLVPFLWHFSGLSCPLCLALTSYFVQCCIKSPLLYYSVFSSMLYVLDRYSKPKYLILFLGFRIFNECSTIYKTCMVNN